MDGVEATFEGHATRVQCRFEGPFEFRALLELTGEVRAYCVEHGRRRVLVDVTASRGELGALERYEHAVLIAQTGGLGIRTAILARPDQVFPIASGRRSRAPAGSRSASSPTPPRRRTGSWAARPESPRAQQARQGGKSRA